MTNADFVEVLSYLAGSWALGWCFGKLMLVIHQASEKI